MMSVSTANEDRRSQRVLQALWLDGEERKIADDETTSDICYDEPRELLGSFERKVFLAGEELDVCGDVRLSSLSLFRLDPHPHVRSPSVTISEDGRSATCVSSDCRAVVFGTVGFSRGVHSNFQAAVPTVRLAATRAASSA